MASPCRELEIALKNNERKLPERILHHVEECPSCAAVLQSWRDISEAARTMKRSWDSPTLWPRIEQTLAEESLRSDHRKSSCNWIWTVVRTLGTFWQPVLVGAILVVLGLWGTWSLLTRFQPESGDLTRLLTEQALREVEATEQAYIQSIEKLSRLAHAPAPTAESSVLPSYREKLVILDAAIADCRSHIELNRFNTHLRRELLSMYQEKQNTLQELLKEINHARN